MNRTARRVAMSAAAGAVALALTSPAAVADDGEGYEGERDGYSAEYDESGSEDADDQESEDYDAGDSADSDEADEADDSDDSADAEDDHSDGDEYDDDSDGREYDAYRAGDDEDDADDDAEESRSHSAYRGHGEGDTRHDERHEKWGGEATENAGDADERAPQAALFTEQQTAILTHLSRADAFLADLSERISAADLEPGLKNALLSLIAERRDHLAGLVAQVRAATSWEDLKSLRDDAYGEMTEPAT